MPDTLDPVVDTQDPAPDSKPVVDVDSMAIPETYKDNPNVSKYKNVGELIKGHDNAVKMLGQKGVIIPKDDAPQEEKDRFYNSLGRPEKPEGYKFTPVDKLHPSIKITPETENWWRKTAHEEGLSQATADRLNQKYLLAQNAAIIQHEAAEQAELESAETALRQKWGKDYDANLQMATRFIAKFGPKGAVERFNGRDPLVIETLANAAKRMSEDNIEKFGASDLSANVGQVKGQIKELTAKIMAMSQSDPDYDRLIEQRTKLYEILAGEDNS